MTPRQKESPEIEREHVGSIGMTQFALRQWDRDFVGTRIEGISPEELVRLVNDALKDGAPLVDGYAPFCKHLFIENTTGTRAGYVPLTPENRGSIRVGYVVRREGELPVLQMWLEGVPAPRARFLDVILYTQEQLQIEAGNHDGIKPDVPDAAYGIVSINGELQAAESPMMPMTMMRNALGVEEGGSGHLMDREAYLRSVAFWESHAVVK